MDQSIPADPLAFESWESKKIQKARDVLTKISSVHFRSAENDHNVLSKLISLHSFPIHKNSPRFSCQIKISVENNAPFVLIKTNVTEVL